tara:strand:+ start:29 stop:205 length:177 start_codon:yes stop_codon:yes gene_type:complete
VRGNNMKKWKEVLKVGGPVATSNAGFKPGMYQEAVNPKKKKKKKKHPVIPKEKDFWRD